MKILSLFVGLFVVFSCSFVSAGLPRGICDLGEVSVSGISSGGYMAVQMEVAYSSLLRGAGVIAGGPWYCANNNVAIATTSCMNLPIGIVVPELVTSVLTAQNTLQIDALSNMKNHKVWLFSGTKDTVVEQGVVKKLESFLEYFVDKKNIHTEYGYKAEHAFITNNYGNACDHLGSPFINNCGLDASGAILEHIYGTLNPPVDPIADNIVEFDQTKFIPPIYLAPAISLHEKAYAYIPTNCQKSGARTCKLHIAFHGCEQDIPRIGLDFVQHTQYNGWAEANDIVIVYPQTTSNILNPKSCWDWWGYTGVEYPARLGPQMNTIYNMIGYFTD
eukprot:TRINITY_DN82341_c0_g1_i1.p1 TRINITY_DN82341_c0_g1~~TRINITY_DN82341_c0_g1_i1.p1  ORF type:complete len:332 (-),score=72.05 TRINITY_DN82341_c0_g1_i1:138-1133(-)